MVNTFLPEPDYAASAAILDYRRLGKQRVETLQLIRANLGLTKGWVNHPAAVMWRGYEYALTEYGEAICEAWIDLGYNDTCLSKIISYKEHLLLTDHPSVDNGHPYWLGDQVLHDSHKSNLLRKDITYYSQYNWTVPDTLPYYWPPEISIPNTP